MSDNNDKGVAYTVRLVDKYADQVAEMSVRDRRTRNGQVLHILDVAFEHWAYLSERAFARQQEVFAAALAATASALDDAGAEQDEGGTPISVRLPPELANPVTRLAAVNRRSDPEQVAYMVMLALDHWPVLIRRVVDRTYPLPEGERTPTERRTPVYA